MSELKPVLFSAFRKVVKLLSGTGAGGIPGAVAVYNFLSQLLWPSKAFTEVQGSKMHFNLEGLPKGCIANFPPCIISGVWEKLTTEMFKKVVKEEDVVLDLGAHCGYYTLLAARLVGRKGKVYAFEPEPINYGLLIKNIELNGYDNIVPVQKAVSNITGTVRLFLDDKNTGGHTVCQPDEKVEFIEVESVTLDEFFKDRKHPINVIKMDIEGAEMAAFLGMERILGENQNLKMFVEFYPPYIRRSGESPEDFVRVLLKDYGFSILAMDNRRHLKIHNNNNIDELMRLCRGKRVANLFLERR